MIELLTYFVAGAVLDVLITIYYFKITGLAVGASGFMSFCVTMFQVFVLYQILLSPDALERTIAYSLGCGVGTSAVVYWKKKHEQTRNCNAQRE